MKFQAFHCNTFSARIIFAQSRTTDDMPDGPLQQFFLPQIVFSLNKMAKMASSEIFRSFSSVPQNCFVFTGKVLHQTLKQPDQLNCKFKGKRYVTQLEKSNDIIRLCKESLCVLSSTFQDRHECSTLKPNVQLCKLCSRRFNTLLRTKKS